MNTCRRCGRELTRDGCPVCSRRRELLAVPVDGSDDLRARLLDTAAAMEEARKIELFDRLSPQQLDDYDRALMENDDQRDYAEERFNAALLREEEGEADGETIARLLAPLAAVAVAVWLVLLFWHWLIGAGVIYAAYRHLTRGTRRRRPRSSWAKNLQAVSVAYAAWNSRRLVRRNGRVLRVSVPAKAGAEHFDYGEGVPY